MPKPDVSDQRKAQILAAAHEVFGRRPYEDVTMRELIAHSGLSTGAVYWYFSGKEAILAALLEDMAAANLAVLERLQQETGPVAARLQAFFEHMIAQAQEMSSLYLTGAKYRAMLSSDPDTRATMERIGAAYRSGLQALIEEGMARGEFRPLPSAEVTTALLALYEGVMLLWVAAPAAVPLRESLQTAAELVLTGLTAGSYQAYRPHPTP
jgi:AcrR family transcriptional regulator